MTTSEQQTKNVPDISSGMVTLLAMSTGLIVANLYYAQTLVGPISEATGLSAQAAGLIVTLTQIGYCLGLLFIVPLGDLVENRRLIFGQLLLTAAALAAAALANSPLLFLAASLGIGLGAVAAQILVPFAAHLTAESRRGQVVGKVTSGLLLGIMLARPAASLIADHLGWHTIYMLSAIITVSLAFLLRARLPIRQPAAALSYAALLRSMFNLLRTTPVLRRRAAYHAGMFAAFSLFWTTAPLALAGAGYHLSQSGIALFALVGVAGALASPIAGRLADQGHTRLATAIALSLGLVGLAIPVLATLSGHLSRPAGIVLLAVASIILDMGVAANLVLGQRSLFVLGADIRSRLNGLYMAIFFAGGALGSALGGWMFANHGWQATLITGMLFPAAALLYYLTEVVGRRP